MDPGHEWTGMYARVRGELESQTWSKNVLFDKEFLKNLPFEV